MKNGIHPEYVECTVRCACGETFVTRSTKGSELRVDICSKCHPFYTGKQKFVDAGGRLDRFKKRLAAVKTYPALLARNGSVACRVRPAIVWRGRAVRHIATGIRRDP